jgi:hypothetical protein
VHVGGIQPEPGGRGARGGKVSQVDEAKKAITLQGDSPKQSAVVVCRNDEQLKQAEMGKTITLVGECHGMIKGVIHIVQGQVIGVGDAAK